MHRTSGEEIQPFEKPWHFHAGLLFHVHVKAAADGEQQKCSNSVQKLVLKDGLDFLDQFHTDH